MRKIAATLLRHNQPLWTRTYARLDSAIPRLSQIALLSAQPRDVIEIYSTITHKQLGTIKVGVGKLVTDYIWENENA